MASESEMASTCHLPPRNNTFLRFNYSDWSKIDIIGQTILLAELTPHFGSFRDACAALKLQSNEVKSFVLTHLHYQDAFDQGRSKVEQWCQNPNLLTNDDNDDIPQQRPLLVCASSLAPVCSFLAFTCYENYIPSIQAWARRTILWPPHIDLTGHDFSKLEDADVIFPKPEKQQTYSRYTSSLGNDTRAVVAFVGTWLPNANGSSDIRISFISLPDGCVVYGPRGVRHLVGAGRYYICWPTQSLLGNRYNDFVIAMNEHSDRKNDNTLPGPRGHEQRQGSHGRNYGLTTSMLDQDLFANDATIPALATVNPKTAFGTTMFGGYNPQAQSAGLLHSQDAPQGPARELVNPQIRQAWANWPGHLFQFRLPHGYVVLGPMGHTHTFDPPPFETYDELGKPHGVGGTYLIVPPDKVHSAVDLKISDLPMDVSLRFQVPYKTALIRNGTVMPRFITSGVHEWSVREGFLDLYNASGCYEVFRTEACYNPLPNPTINSPQEGAGGGLGYANAYRDSYRFQNMELEREVTMSLNTTEEALKKVLPPDRRWFDVQSTNASQRERRDDERVHHEAKLTKDRTRRGAFKEEQNKQPELSKMKETRENISTDAVSREISSFVRTMDLQNGWIGSEQCSARLSDASTRGFLLYTQQTENTQKQIKLQSQSKPKQHKEREQQPSAMTDTEPVAVLTPSEKQKISKGPTRRKRLNSDELSYKPKTRRRAVKPRASKRTRTPSVGIQAQKEPTSGADGAVADPQPAPVPRKGRRRGRPTNAEIMLRRAADPDLDNRTNQNPTTAPATRRPRQSADNRKPIGPLLAAIQANPIAESGGDRAFILPIISQETEVSENNNGGADGVNETSLGVGAAIPTAATQEDSSYDLGTTKYETNK